ncbi:hypothetical protein LINPERHAP1_LOCUS17759 [Linum perenne]
MEIYYDHRLNRFDERKQRWVYDLPPPEQEPMSSVSNASLEEDVAVVLVMMSREVNWRMRNRRFLTDDDEIEEGEALVD